MKILAVFYFIVSLFDWAEHRLGVNVLLAGDIVCWNTKFVEVITKRGAWYMMLLAITDFIYTLIIIFVFYEVPKRCFHQFRQ